MELHLIRHKNAPIEEHELEIVERKGIGHPDTLADGIAESFSHYYSRYCRDNFGVIPNHWVDKVHILGGVSKVGFGKSNVITPMNISVMGKITSQIGSKKIPLREIANLAVESTMQRALPSSKLGRDYTITVASTSGAGPGRSINWYRPPSSDVLKKSIDRANDTVACTAYAPLSATESLVLKIERTLNGKEFAEKHPEIGSDIKIMAVRKKNDLTLTLCVPFIGRLTPSRQYYDAKKKAIQRLAERIARRSGRFKNITIGLNTRDTEKQAYLTSCGTAADGGDCGAVGRGNRSNGLISLNREMSIEAPSGKNAVYQVGKIYNFIANNIANRVFNETGIENYVNIVTQNGRDIRDPQLIAVKLLRSISQANKQKIKKIIESELGKIQDVREAQTSGKIELY